MSFRRVLALVLVAGCQGKSEPDLPRPPRLVVEARAHGVTTARIVAGHPCRAEIDSEELMVGTVPLVAQVGNHRWSGDPVDHGTAVRRDGTTIVQLRERPDAAIDVVDPHGAPLLGIRADGAVINEHGNVLRRAEHGHAALTVGDSIVTGTADPVLAVLVTAPELIPEVRALAVCHRLFAQEQAARK